MTHASVFSGIGGPELAAAWLGCRFFLKVADKIP